MVEEWNEIDKDLDEVDAEIEAVARSAESCRRLLTVPGVGPLVATEMVAAIGNGSAFNKGREFATWWQSSLNSIRPEARRSCWESVSEGMSIFDVCSFTAHAPWCVG